MFAPGCGRNAEGGQGRLLAHDQNHPLPPRCCVPSCQRCAPSFFPLCLTRVCVCVRPSSLLHRVPLLHCAFACGGHFGGGSVQHTAWVPQPVQDGVSLYQRGLPHQIPFPVVLNEAPATLFFILSVPIPYVHSLVQWV